MPTTKAISVSVLSPFQNNLNDQISGLHKRRLLDLATGVEYQQHHDIELIINLAKDTAHTVIQAHISQNTYPCKDPQGQDKKCPDCKGNGNAVNHRS